MLLIAEQWDFVLLIAKYRLTEPSPLPVKNHCLIHTQLFTLFFFLFFSPKIASFAGQSFPFLLAYGLSMCILRQDVQVRCLQKLEKNHRNNHL